MFSNPQDEELWFLIARVVSGNASPEEEQRLSRVREKEPEVHRILTELQAYWNLEPAHDDFDCEVSFERLEKRLREMPD